MAGATGVLSTGDDGDGVGGVMLVGDGDGGGVGNDGGGEGDGGGVGSDGGGEGDGGGVGCAGGTGGIGSCEGTSGESEVCSTRFKSSRECCNLAAKALMGTLVPSLRDLSTALRTRLTCAIENSSISTPRDLCLASGLITSRH